MTAVEGTRADYEAMSLEELGKLTIQFGQSKRGMTFARVVQEDPHYVAWFVGTYDKEEPKATHVGFLTFVRKYVEQGETNAKTATSKAKAKSSCAPTPLAAESDSEEEMDEPTWDVIDKQADQDVRLTRLEGSVSLILQQLGEMTAFLKQGPPAAP